MAAGQFYRGENLRLSFNGNPLYHATNCSLSVSTANEELATKDIDGTQNNMGNYSGTLSAEALLADKPASPAYVDPIDLLQFQLNKTQLDWEFTTGVAGDKRVSGKCFVSSSDIGAENQAVATASFQFLVDGDILIETLPVV